MVEGAASQNAERDCADHSAGCPDHRFFAVATATLWPRSPPMAARRQHHRTGGAAGMPDSTTIGGLLSAIGVAGMSRMLGANVIATSGRAVEAAGDVDVLLLDKTGTITLR